MPASSISHHPNRQVSWGLDDESLTVPPASVRRAPKVQPPARFVHHGMLEDVPADVPHSTLRYGGLLFAGLHRSYGFVVSCWRLLLGCIDHTVWWFAVGVSFCFVSSQCPHSTPQCPHPTPQCPPRNRSQQAPGAGGGGGRRLAGVRRCSGGAAPAHGPAAPPTPSSAWQWLAPWHAMATAQAPNTRHAHTASCSGKRMDGIGHVVGVLCLQRTFVCCSLSHLLAAAQLGSRGRGRVRPHTRGAVLHAGRALHST